MSKFFLTTSIAYVNGAPHLGYALEVVQADAVKLKGWSQLLADPRALENAPVSLAMVTQLLQMKNLVPQKAREIARRIVRAVVKQLQDQMRTTLERVLSTMPDPLKLRRQGPVSQLDWRRTLKANLRHYRPELGCVIPERVYFRDRRSVEHRKNNWEIIVLVDQSGSMGESLIHASVLASVLTSLQAVSTRLLLFDTQVVDMSNHLQDPVEILFGATLGGGTSICSAVSHAAKLIKDPKHTLFVLITDLGECGALEPLLTLFSRLKYNGVTLACLLGMTNLSQPNYDQANAKRVASIGVPTFCATPDRFAELIGRVLRGEGA